MNDSTVSEPALQGLLTLAKKSVDSFAAAVKASKGTPPADPAEVAKLEEAAKTDRAVFDAKRRETLGNPVSPEGRANSRAWNHYAQKAYVLGLVNENVFRYLDADGRFAQMMKGTAVSYVQGHKVLGWEIRHGVNPRSVQTLRDALTRELAKAEQSVDVNRVQDLRRAKSELERNAKGLLERPVEQTSAEPRTAAASIGEQVGSAVVNAVAAETPAPRTPRRGRQAQAR